MERKFGDKGGEKVFISDGFFGEPLPPNLPEARKPAKRPTFLNSLFRSGRSKITEFSFFALAFNVSMTIAFQIHGEDAGHNVVA